MGRGAVGELLKLLRVAATSATATATGLLNAATRRERGPRIVLSPGDLAPDFVLAASNGRTYHLSSYRNRQAVVLFWFPRAFTGGCTVECRSMQQHGGLEQYDVAIFGASVDSAETNRRFADAVGARYPILSDPDKTVARAYGVLGASGFPSRWTFHIGIDGRIQAIDKQVRVASHGDDVAARLEALRIPRRT
jgi:thioredoxin-dependent peroxiredoxin